MDAPYMEGKVRHITIPEATSQSARRPNDSRSSPRGPGKGSFVTLPVHSLPSPKAYTSFPDIRPPSGRASESVSWHASPRSTPYSTNPNSSAVPFNRTLPLTMEQYLARELQLVEANDPLAALVPHRQVLKMFTSAFPSFASILEKVESAFDAAIIAGNGPNMHSLKRHSNSATDVHGPCREEVTDLRGQIEYLQVQLAESNAHQDKTHAEAAIKHKHTVTRQRLEGQIDSYKGRLATYEESQKEDLERMLTLIRTAKVSECRVRAVDMELRQQKNELEKMNSLTRMLRSLEKELRELRHTYSLTVPMPVHQAVKADLEKSLAAKETELRMTRRLCALRSTERDTVIAKYEALEKRMEPSPSRPLTPRLPWKEMLADYPSVMDAVFPVTGSLDGTTSDVVTEGIASNELVVGVLLKRIQELEHQVSDWLHSGYRADDTSIDWGQPLVAQASQRNGSVTQGRSMMSTSRVSPPAMILAYGDSPTVPPYLRAWGLIHRVPISLTTVRQLIVRLFETHIKTGLDWKDPGVRVAFELHNYIPDLLKAFPSLHSATIPAVPFMTNARGRSISNGAGLMTTITQKIASSQQGRAAGASLSGPLPVSIADPIAFGYSLYLGAKDYSQRCPLCLWFVRCLEGSMPPALIYAAIDVFKAAREDVVALAELHGRSSIKRGPLMESLGSVFITKSIEELEEIRLSLGEESSIDVTQIVSLAHPFSATLIMQDCNAGMKLYVAVVEGLTAASVPQRSVVVSAQQQQPDTSSKEELGDDTPRKPTPPVASPMALKGPDDALVIEVGEVRRVLLSLEPRCPEAILTRVVRDPHQIEYYLEGIYVTLRMVLDNLYGLGLTRFSPGTRDVHSSSGSQSATATPTSLLPLAVSGIAPPRASLSTPSIMHSATPTLPPAASVRVGSSAAVSSPPTVALAG